MKARGRKLTKPKRRKASTAARRRSSSAVDLHKQLDQQGRELAKARKHLAEALEQQTATSDILRVIRGSPSTVQPVFDAVAESAARLCESLDSAVWRRESDRLVLVAHHGAIPQTGSASFLPLVRGTVGGRSVLDGRTIHIADIRTKGDEFPNTSKNARRQGYRTILSVPLMREGAAIGAIVLRRTEARLFSERQIALLQTFADQAVIAIENVRLFEKEQQRTRELSELLEQQTATAEVLHVISSSPGELEPVFHAMLENATRVCGSNFGTLYLREGEAFRAVSMHGATPDYLRSRLGQLVHPGPGTGLGRAVRTKQAVHIADVTAEPAYRERDPMRVAAADLGGVRTMLNVPMLKEGEVVGGIAIYRTEIRPFTEKQIELVTNFAHQAVIAIENTRLLNELRQRTDDLSESLEQQTGTAEVLKVISGSAGELEPVFKAIVESGLRLFPGAMVIVALADRDKVKAAAVAAPDPAGVEAMRRRFPFPLTREYMHSTTILDRKIVDIPDVENAPAELAAGARNFLASGYRAVTIMPMIRGDAAIGALSVARGAPGPLSDKQIAVLKTFAAQAVIAIENTRLLNELRQRTDD